MPESELGCRRINSVGSQVAPVRKAIHVRY
jgi:hypothetical protein